MSNFTLPTIGSKLGEFKPKVSYRFLSILQFGFFSRQFNWFISRVIPVAIILAISVSIAKMEMTGIKWLDWTFAGIGILLALYLIAVDIYATLYLKTVKSLQGNSISLFLVKDGVEIDDSFIPFKNYSFIGFGQNPNGVVLFKIDGDYLLIKTEDDPFLTYSGIINENQMKFNIEPKYLAHKEELLAYLNSLIDENQQ
jgi:hypothetical protein